MSAEQDMAFDLVGRTVIGVQARPGAPARLILTGGVVVEMPEGLWLRFDRRPCARVECPDGKVAPADGE